MRNDYGSRHRPDQDWRTQGRRYGSEQRYSGQGDWRDSSPQPDRGAGRARGEGLGPRDGRGGARSPEDQRHPQSGRANPSRYWQGGGMEEQGTWAREREHIDRRGYGRGNQFGRAGQYGRSHEMRDRLEQGYEGDYDWGDDFGRGDERMQDDDDPHPYTGARRAEPGERLRSRSADPGQSSYGGFRDENPRFQRQQFTPGAHEGDWEQWEPRWQGGHRYTGEGRGSRGAAREGPRRMGTLPKGYLRTDERLREDVCERLSYSGLDVSDVSVDVQEAEVILNGTVDTRSTKHAIENCADACPGVKDVQNNIKIRRD